MWCDIVGEAGEYIWKLIRLLEVKRVKREPDDFELSYTTSRPTEPVF